MMANFDLGFIINIDPIYTTSNNNYDMADWGGISDSDMMAILSAYEPITTTNPLPGSAAADVDETPAPAAPLALPAIDIEPMKTSLTEQDLLNFEAAKDEKSTKSSTNWGVRRLKGNLLNISIKKIPKKPKKNRIATDYINTAL